jgi:hypothetical protein
MGASTRILFSFNGRREGKAEGAEEVVEAVGNAATEAIEWRAFVPRQSGVAGDGLQDRGGEGRVDTIERQADRVALGRQSVAAEWGSFSTRPLARSLERS